MTTPRQEVFRDTARTGPTEVSSPELKPVLKERVSVIAKASHDLEELKKQIELEQTAQKIERAA